MKEDRINQQREKTILALLEAIELLAKKAQRETPASALQCAEAAQALAGACAEIDVEEEEDEDEDEDFVH